MSIAWTANLVSNVRYQMDRGSLLLWERLPLGWEQDHNQEMVDKYCDSSLPPISGTLPTKSPFSLYYKTGEKASHKSYFPDGKKLILSKNG